MRRKEEKEGEEEEGEKTSDPHSVGHFIKEVC